MRRCNKYDSSIQAALQGFCILLVPNLVAENHLRRHGTNRNGGAQSFWVEIKHIGADSDISLGCSLK